MQQKDADAGLPEQHQLRVKSRQIELGHLPLQHRANLFAKILLSRVKEPKSQSKRRTIGILRIIGALCSETETTRRQTKRHPQPRCLLKLKRVLLLRLHGGNNVLPGRCVKI